MSATAVFGWAKLLAPLILGNIPATRPLATRIGALMEEAEALKNAKGKDKLAHVTTCAHQIGAAINTEKPGAVDLQALDGAVQSGIDAAFQVSKLVADAHGHPTGDTLAIPT